MNVLFILSQIVPTSPLHYTSANWFGYTSTFILVIFAGLVIRWLSKIALELKPVIEKILEVTISIADILPSLARSFSQIEETKKDVEHIKESMRDLTAKIDRIKDK